MAQVTLKNPRFPELEEVRAEALADTGPVHLRLPEDLARELRLEVYDRKQVALADGSSRTVPYMGPVEIRFKNRTAITGALVFGNQVLLGAIPMEDMDLVVSPRDRTIDVNPKSPEIACSSAK